MGHQRIAGGLRQACGGYRDHLAGAGAWLPATENMLVPLFSTITRAMTGYGSEL
jgi:hypothetical protein